MGFTRYTQAFWNDPLAQEHPRTVRETVSTKSFKDYGLALAKIDVPLFHVRKRSRDVVIKSQEVACPRNFVDPSGDGFHSLMLQVNCEDCHSEGGLGNNEYLVNGVNEGLRKWVIYEMFKHRKLHLNPLYTLSMQKTPLQLNRRMSMEDYDRPLGKLHFVNRLSHRLSEETDS
ncbi:Ndr family protein [Clonorchis sinensis]|uniref:Ndr family protein n=1 Tax=Clonorchis sinensis TaxID=79923 RepID=G7YXM8_CLOSI|nr:Ndr family protein [Clonorchis sinensis]